MPYSHCTPTRPRPFPEVSMSDFSTEIQRRAEEARRALVEARTASDDYLASVLVGDLESLARLAADHSITLPGVAEMLACESRPASCAEPA